MLAECCRCCSSRWRIAEAGTTESPRRPLRQRQRLKSRRAATHLRSHLLSEPSRARNRGRASGPPVQAPDAPSQVKAPASGSKESAGAPPAGGRAGHDRPGGDARSSPPGRFNLVTFTTKWCNPYPTCGILAGTPIWIATSRVEPTSSRAQPTRAERSRSISPTVRGITSWGNCLGRRRRAHLRLLLLLPVERLLDGQWLGEDLADDGVQPLYLKTAIG